MKTKLLLILFVFLVSCGSPAPEIVYVEITSAPEIVYVEITSTPEPTPKITVGCEFYFNTWETAKKNQGANGMHFWLGNESLIFATTEESALHEVGHLVDVRNGYSSQDEAFQDAVYEYVYSPPIDVQDELHHYLYVMIAEYGDLYDEAYAQLYMWNILYELPHEFEEFYVR